MLKTNMLIFLEIKQENIINQLFPNIWVFIAHVIATIVLLIVLSIFLYTPFKKIMRKRRIIIKGLIEDAIKKQAQATKYETEANVLLKESKIQSQDMLNGAKIEALNQRQEIINQANREAKLIDEQNRRDLLKERIRAEENIRQEIIDVAFVVAQNILDEEITRKKNQIIIDDFIKNLD